jgi:hypothetical protein
MTVRHIFEISEDDHPPNIVGHPRRDNWWTLDFANAFVSPGVNSRGELVPSHGASRRRLGDYNDCMTIDDSETVTNISCKYISFSQDFVNFKTLLRKTMDVYLLRRVLVERTT